MTERKIRVWVGKPGLDGDDRGAKTIVSTVCSLVGTKVSRNLRKGE